ncbi:MAG: RNA-binding protein, partial [Ignavibacteriales bacterium]|nr:RNA-binding protein [Ignavibacteriales bacterium]
MKLYVGNLSTSVTEEDLKSLFSSYGNLSSVAVIKDRFTQDSKGFGFVEFMTGSEGLKAMKELNSKELKGKEIVVNEARPKTDNRSGGGGFNS